MKTIIDRILVQLKANEPRIIYPQNGIDCVTADFTFRYPPLVKDSVLEIKFTDADGRAISDSISLPASGVQKFMLDFSWLDGRCSWINAGNTRVGGVEFKCKHDFTFEFFVEEEEEVLFGI